MEKWIKWTVLEASTKTLVASLHKFLGVAAKTYSGMYFVIMLTGLAQAIVSLLYFGEKKEATQRQKIGAMLFGVMAVVINICSIGAYLNGGELSLVILIGTLSIIPGAFIDLIFFGKKLSLIQWIGLGIGVFAGYAMLGFPSLNAFKEMPIWIWLAFGRAFFLAVNQGITQKIKDVHPIDKNYWGGSATAILAIVLLLFSSGLDAPMDPRTGMSTTWLIVGLSVLIGIVTFFMWSFNLFAYKDGAYIALKKLVMNVSFLGMAAVVATVFYGESFGANKILGLVLYLVAIVVMDDKARQNLKQLIGF